MFLLCTSYYLHWAQNNLRMSFFILYSLFFLSLFSSPSVVDTIDQELSTIENSVEVASSVDIMQKLEHRERGGS